MSAFVNKSLIKIIVRIFFISSFSDLEEINENTERCLIIKTAMASIKIAPAI